MQDSQPSSPEPPKPKRTPSFFSNVSQNIRSFLGSPTSPSSIASTSSIEPHIPHIHPNEYSDHERINKRLRSFKSTSIAQSRLAASTLPRSDTYIGIHCGDQNCCFSEPYSTFRTPSRSNSKTRSPSSSLRRRPRKSLSNPSLRLSGLRNSVPDEPSPLHFTDDDDETDSSRPNRAISLFSGSPPPPDHTSSPLYEYPDPVGSRSSSWISQPIIDSPRIKLPGPVNINRMATQQRKPSGLSLFWTADDVDDEGIKERIQTGGEIAYKWDGAFGRARKCTECQMERCVICADRDEVIPYVVEEEKVISGERGFVPVCTPCEEHGFCKGRKLWLRVRCKMHGEVDCFVCEEREVLGE